VDAQSDILESLGLSQSGGYNTPGTDAGFDMAQPSSPEDALNQAKVLARLKPPTEGNGMGRFAAGMGAKGGKVPGNKWAAGLDGFATGFSGAMGNKSTREKEHLQSVRERMGLLKQLFGMEQSLRREKSQNDYRERALNRVGRRGNGAERDPLLREKNINELVKETDAWKELDKDKGLPSTSKQKLTPERRAELQAAVDAERKRLQSLPYHANPPVAGDEPDESAAPGATPPAGNPGRKGLPPQPELQPPAAVSPDPSTVRPPRRPAAATMTPPEEAETTEAPADPASIVRPPSRPKYTREQLIGFGKEKLAKGVALDDIRKASEEQFGVKLTPEDFGIQPATKPAPAPDSSVDPMGNATGAGPGADAGSIQGILQSLFT
jgi:hypothetical protein